MISLKIGRYFFVCYFLLALNMCSSANGITGNKGHPKLDLSDRFYQKQINYKPDDETKTQAPIGNIVYEIDDEDDSQNIYHSPDAIDNIDDDDKDIDINGDGDGAQPMNNRRQQSTKYSDRIDDTAAGSKLSGDGAPKQQLQRYDGDENGARQRHHSSHAVATDKLIEKQMNHKNWERGTARNAKSHRSNHNNKWHRRHYKLMKHHKLKPGRHNDSDNDDDGKRQRKHKPKFRSGFQHHGNIVGTGSGNSMTSAASRSIYNSKFKSNPPYIQAHINFFDTNGNDDDDSLKLNKYPANGIRQSKWPNLSRLQTQLHQDIIDDSLPPYIKKYNRRNKQLVGLLEGTVSPLYEQTKAKSAHQRRRQKNRNKWIEMNLFEEQRRPVTPALPALLPPVAITVATTPPTSLVTPMSMNASNDKTYKYTDKMSNFLLSKNVQSEPNGLPGEHLSLSSEEDDADMDHGPYHGDANKRQHQQIYPVSPKADSFLFHRVASPKLVGTGIIGNGLVKQRLPFVAITDRRIGEGPQRRIISPQNNMPLP